MTCFLVRHGQDDDSVRGGWSESELTELGIVQASDLARYIADHKEDLNIGSIYSSDLPRAEQTAQFLSDVLALPIERMGEFRETNNGALAGMPNDVANERYPNLYWSSLEWDECYPEGESPKIFFERIRTAWSEFSSHICQNHKNVVLVTHSGVINIIIHLINDACFSNKEKQEHVPHATLIALEYGEGMWKV